MSDILRLCSNELMTLKVKNSRLHGKGLFAAEAIPARRKLGELTGEKISIRESKRRLRGVDVIMMVEFEDGTALDATGGNEFRHVNHSCEPNTYIRRAHGRVEFYSLRAIRAGEELTCDYGETQHAGGMGCRCGSRRCRGRV